MADPVTGATSSAALTPEEPWESKRFPGVKPEELKEAFRILNEWAKALREYEFKLAAMSAILQVTLNMHDDDMFKNVVQEMKGGHDRRKIKDLLDRGHAGHGAPVHGYPSDVVGHPPGPPFVDGTI